MTCYTLTKIWVALLQLSCYYAVASFDQDPRNQFYNYVVIQPTVYQESFVQKDSGSFKDGEKAEAAKLLFEAFGKNFVVDLRENENLFSPNYKEIYEQDEEEVVYKPINKEERKCYFHGYLPNIENSWAAISTCDGISGVVSDGKETYYIEPRRIAKKVEHLLFKASDHKHGVFKCGVEGDLVFEQDEYLNGLKVENLDDPYKSNSDSRYIEVVVINDNSMFKKYNRSASDVFNRNKQVLNVASAVLSRLNIFLSLQSLRVWMKQDWIEIIPSNPTQSLNNFLKFRKEKLLKFDPNDNAIFFTGQVYDGGVVGNAYVGRICTPEQSGENVSDDGHLVAGLLGGATAHEIGHNLGSQHDDDGTKCKCADEYCVMFPYMLPDIPTHWSSCSESDIRMAFTRGQDSCLRNKPTKVEGPSCGNGYLEQGEECDCGIKELCEDPCCDAMTCTKTRGNRC